MTKRSCKVALIALTLALSACSSTIETPYGPPVAFDGTAYCTEVDRTAPISIPADVTTRLDSGVKNDPAVADALLVKAAIEIAHAAETVEACQDIFNRGQSLFSNTLATSRKNLAGEGGFDPSSDPEILNTQTDITRLWREDQSARGALLGLSTKDRSGSAFWAQRLATAHAIRIDTASLPAIRRHAQTYGWIDRKRFGHKVSAHAWILVQHADDNPDFQAQMLAAMEPYLSRGEVSKKNYAYLWDRVAVNTGRKQRYGTQPTWQCDDSGKMALKPLEDPENVNARRADMGLGTVEDGLAEMEASVCR